MKSIAIAVAAGAIVLSGCTTTTPTSTTASLADQRQRELSEKRVHSHEELRKTGRPEIGDALQTVDPSITYNPGH